MSDDTTTIGRSLESSLLRHPEVAAAAVVSHADARGHSHLIAYVAPASGALDLGALSRHLAYDLPEFTHPVTFVALRAIPLLPNGELDHRSLPLPAGTGHPEVSVAPPAMAMNEIEALLVRHPSVDNAVVLPISDGNETLLVAYVVPSWERVDLDALRTYVRDAMPGIAVPSTLVALPKIPLTPSGEVDRDALPGPGWGFPPSKS